MITASESEISACAARSRAAVSTRNRAYLRGETVAPTDTIGTVADLSRVWAELWVFERELSLVRVGDLLSFYAKIERVGTTSVTVEVQVLAQRLATQNAYVQVAHAILTYVAIDDEGRPRPVAPAAVH